mgnify:CR=1 FL=1
MKKTTINDMDDYETSSRSSDRRMSISSTSSSDLRLRKENSQTLFETIKQQHQQQQAKANLPYREEMTPTQKQQSFSRQSSNISTPTSLNNPFAPSLSSMKEGIMDKSSKNQEATTIITSKPLEKANTQNNSLFGNYTPKKG